MACEGNIGVNLIKAVMLTASAGIRRLFGMDALEVMSPKLMPKTKCWKCWW